jgi:hypothetical protein
MRLHVFDDTGKRRSSDGDTRESAHECREVKGLSLRPEVKAAIKAALQKGDQTAAGISKKYGPSVFSINAGRRNGA